MKHLLFFLLVLIPLAAHSEGYELIEEPLPELNQKVTQQNQLLDALAERTREETFQLQIQNNNLLYGIPPQQIQPQYYYVVPPAASTQDRAIGGFVQPYPYRY